jgi:hypothetical protein
MITLQWRVVYVKEGDDKREERLEITGNDFREIIPGYLQRLEALSAKKVVVSEFLGYIEKEDKVTEDSFTERNV